MEKVVRKLAMACLLLFAFAGNSQAQDKPFVIKKTNYANAGGEHYLAHVKQGDHYVLQDATTFSPDCLWYSGRETSLSGTNHNYYFIDDAGQYRFLSAPLEHGGALTLSDSKPPVYLLNNTDHNYYFYDWDYDNWPDGAGVARGHQHNGVLNEDDCTYTWGDGQCWEVYWVECVGTQWKLSTEYSYTITENSGRFHRVTDTPFAMQVTTTGNGLNNLGNFDMEFSTPSHSLSATFTGVPFDYIPAYHKYDFDEVTDTLVTPHTISHHTYYYPYGSTNTSVPTSAQAVPSGNPSQWTYNWSVSGAGAEYLSFSNEGTTFIHTSTSATPTLYYRTPNNDGHKDATLTLTVIYQDGSSQTTSCTVTVKTPCQNPSFSANVTYEGVIVSWTHTADSYTVKWKKQGESEWNSASTTDVTYTITGLEYGTTYEYQVIANCQSSGQSQTFTALAEPTALVYGAVFGGGRMADVNGNTEVVIINTDSISAVYGGNDIAGEVKGTNGSTVILGINAETNSSSYSQLYNNGNASSKVRVGDVYGGGNGYYLYGTEEFEGAEEPTVTLGVSEGNIVKDLDGNTIWTNETGAEYEMTLPAIIKTAITVTNNKVKVDSIFGGAKNAFITNDDEDTDGTSITINGGIAYAVFGGNNFGGSQTDGKHYIKVSNTKTSDSYDGIGRTFGIAYVFGGGNKVVGNISDVVINGGMCDTVFGGGNMADVSEANVLVNCTNTISHANENGYLWNGTSLYNVRALFGGNNRAAMSGLPTLTLTKGGIGTVYGGGNAGDMLANVPDDAPNSNPGTGPIATNFGSNFIGNDPLPIYYGTHVELVSDNVFVDYLYGGCQMSNVKYSTWVEIRGGHVGTVYGGCNISGDVGSTRLTFYLPSDQLTNEHKQATQGATYVHASGGTIVGNLFAGSNGYYHCNDGLVYVEGLNFTPGYNFVGMEIPTHNETHVKVSDNVLVKGNVYAGGNLACVGFINETTGGNSYPTFRGFASMLMTGGTVRGNVYGGGNRASIFGSNEVKVSGGSIGYDDQGQVGDGALYGGNDRAGQVAQITNRVYPSGNNYDVASDLETNLRLLGVKTYVGISGKPKVGTVYGGGNGAYNYTPEEYCDVTDQPVQSNTFVDVHIDADGGANTGGYINMVYGGGNGVTVLDRITVFVNVQNMPSGDDAYDQVGTIFGGNNLGDLDILSDIIMLKGQVNTIYGGCNQGRMMGSLRYNDSTNLSSMVHLRSLYRPNGIRNPVVTAAKATGYIFGGCKQADVNNNTLVIVEGGLNTAKVFGGCNVAGTVGGNSQVIVSSEDYDVTTGDVFGGGLGSATAITGKGMVRVCGTKTTVNGDVFGGGDEGVVNGGTDILIGLRPTVTTATVSGITETSATCGGNVTALGSTDLIECGICWGRTPDPMVGDNHVATDEPSAGEFSGLQMTGLEGGKEYYVRAYARNSIGTSYGPNKKFDTPEPQP